MKKKTDTYQAVTDKIIAELEKGAAPWICPWNGGGSLKRPVNANTGKKYNGVNVVLLWMAAQEKGYNNPYWLTYKQASQLGGHVRKGETATQICFFKQWDVEDKETGEEKTIPVLKSFNVFNASQCDDLPEKFHTKETNEKGGVTFDEIASWRDLVKWRDNTGVILSHMGDSAFYNYITDSVTMPEINKFKAASGYWATLFHEFGHWTGHKTRLNREFGKRFGDAAYAAEELVAELTSAFLCAEFGVQGEIRHAGYIENWLKALRGNKKFFFAAASAASKAADLLLAKQAKAKADKAKETLAA